MSVVMARPPRDVVVVTGGDALPYLQSLLSQDLDPLGDGQGAHTLLLTPQGKLDVDCTYLRVGDDAWLICDGGFGSQLASSLTRFKIRVDVGVDQPEGWSVLAVRGDGAIERARAAGVEVPDAAHEHTLFDHARVVRVPWPGGDGVDVVGPAASVDAAEAALRATSVERVGDEVYEALRIGAGVPRQGVDTGDKTIPQEAFLEIDAVSFSKGCFLGQELVCRIDTRGHVNRYLRVLRPIEGGRPPRGSEILAGDKAVGTVTSTVESEELPALALGYVRHEIDPRAEVLLRWDGGEAKAVVELLPS